MKSRTRFALLALGALSACRTETPRLANGMTDVISVPIQELSDLGLVSRSGSLYRHMLLLYETEEYSLEDDILAGELDETRPDAFDIEKARVTWSCIRESPPEEASVEALSRELTRFVEDLRRMELTQSVAGYLLAGREAELSEIVVRVEQDSDPTRVFADRGANEIVLSTGFLRSAVVDTCDGLINRKSDVSPRQDTPFTWVILLKTIPLALENFDLPPEKERHIVRGFRFQQTFRRIIWRIGLEHPDLWESLVAGSLDARQLPGLEEVVQMLEGASRQTQDPLLRQEIAEAIDLLQDTPGLEVDDWYDVLSNFTTMSQLKNIVYYPIDAESIYLRALLFVLAHEAAHLWFEDEEVPQLDNEVNADVFGELVSFYVTYGNLLPLQTSGLPLESLYEEPLESSGWPVSDTDELGFSTLSRVLRDLGFESDLAVYPSLEERVERGVETLVGALQVVWPSIDWTDVMESWGMVESETP